MHHVLPVLSLVQLFDRNASCAARTVSGSNVRPFIRPCVRTMFVCFGFFPRKSTKINSRTHSVKFEYIARNINDDLHLQTMYDVIWNCLTGTHVFSGDILVQSPLSKCVYQSQQKS